MNTQFKPHHIITVEFAEPDVLGFHVFEVARHHNSQADKFTLDMLADFWSTRRWTNQIMRVKPFKTNLPALLPANKNHSWSLPK